MNSKLQKDKEEVISLFRKLIDLGFIVRYDDPPNEEKQHIDASQVQYDAVLHSVAARNI